MIKLLNYTGRLNTIPAFVLDEDELIYSSFSHLEEDAKAVLRNLSGNASEIFDVAGREMFACIPHKVGRKTLRIILGPGSPAFRIKSGEKRSASFSVPDIR